MSFPFLLWVHSSIQHVSFFSLELNSDFKMVILFYPAFQYISCKTFLIRSVIHVTGSHFHLFLTLAITFMRKSYISKVRGSGIDTVRDFKAFAKWNMKTYAQICQEMDLSTTKTFPALQHHNSKNSLDFLEPIRKKQIKTQQHKVYLAFKFL